MVFGHCASPLADLIQKALVFRGRHLLYHCCRVQASVTLSIEPELYAQIQGLQESLSLTYLMEELRPAECRTLMCVTEVDSTARKAIMLRHGVGQLQHLATRTVWALRKH